MVDPPNNIAPDEYVRYDDGEFILDGHFTIAELKALIEWAEAQRAAG